MRRMLVCCLISALCLSLTVPFSAESLDTEELEELLDYVPYSAHENLTLENTEENLKTDPFVWAFIQECVDEFGIDTSDRRYWELCEYVPGVEEMIIHEGEIFYEEELLQDIMMKMYNTKNINLGWAAGGQRYKTIYVPYEVGGFLFDFESGKYIYSNLAYLGGDFGNLPPYEYSHPVEYRISGDGLYIYERYAVYYRSDVEYFMYGNLNYDEFYPEYDHSDMYEIAVGSASRYLGQASVYSDPMYQKLFSGEMDDELALYKHTYRKNRNGDWYWHSSKLMSVGAEQIPDTSDNSYLYPILAVCSLIIMVGAFTVQKRTKE